MLCFWRTNMGQKPGGQAPPHHQPSPGTGGAIEQHTQRQQDHQHQHRATGHRIGNLHQAGGHQTAGRLVHLPDRNHTDARRTQHHCAQHQAAAVLIDRQAGAHGVVGAAQAMSAGVMASVTGVLYGTYGQAVAYTVAGAVMAVMTSAALWLARPAWGLKANQIYSTTTSSV